MRDADPQRIAIAFGRFSCSTPISNKMSKVYRIETENDYRTFRWFVTENGKILETSLIYHSGLQGTYILDPCVDIESHVWQDANHSWHNLYWLTEKDIGQEQVSVIEVDYRFPFTEPELKNPRSTIGNRKLVLPASILPIS